MVQWFSPLVLLKTLKYYLTSSIFGKYADRRLITALLDPINDEILKTRCEVQNGLFPDQKKEIWLDFVADLGDGFDSTYSIAYLLAQNEIKFSNDLTLPRGDCLIMGGDQVYPYASRDDYKNRMERPYKAAFPKSKTPTPVFLIPGNHDWYDGLTLFLAKFCQGGKNSIGNWKPSQLRSYFARHLGKNWWIWGYDAQLGEDIDKPQNDYFTSVTQLMDPGAKVILCAPKPSWLYADQNKPSSKERDAFYRGLDFIANILKNAKKEFKIPLVLSGDLHHYARYSAPVAGTNFITAGGGGAFLHPTHHLPTRIEASWVSTKQTLNLAQLKKDNNSNHKKACYPSRKKSRFLSFRNIGFIFKNWKFCIMVGLLYSIFALCLLAGHDYNFLRNGNTFSQNFWNQLYNISPSPAFLIIFVLMALICTFYADYPKWKNLIPGILHGSTHSANILFLTTLSSVFAFTMNPNGSDLFYFLFVFLGMTMSGFLGGIIWGLYLWFMSFCLKKHINDAFSAMRLNSFCHFLRLKIEKDKLTLYPIGLDKAPKRKAWGKNENYGKEDQNPSYFIPKNKLIPKLIESPIIIMEKDIKPLGT